MVGVQFPFILSRFKKDGIHSPLHTKAVISKIPEGLHAPSTVPSLVGTWAVGLGGRWSLCHCPARALSPPPTAATEIVLNCKSNHTMPSKGSLCSERQNQTFHLGLEGLLRRVPCLLSRLSPPPSAAAQLYPRWPASSSHTCKA